MGLEQPDIKVTERYNVSIPKYKPEHQIVFIKTHKTASTTTSTIILRYGYIRELSVALPLHHKKKISIKKLFTADQVEGYSRGTKEFNLIAFHLRYNHKELDKVVPGARYITILREPAAQFESAFGYFEIAKHFGLEGTSNPLAVFMKSPDQYYSYRSAFFKGKYQLRNGMAFDLGLPHNIHTKPDKVIQWKIARLGKEFDLVMLTDYYDESLLLLKKLLCWKWHDILYIPKGIRSKSHKYALNQSLTESIRKWNSVDVAMYNHFNRTFWRKIAEYGPEFQSDLLEFRNRQAEFYDECISPQLSQRDQRETGLTLKESASKYCELSYYRINQYNSMIHKQKKYL
uniref:Galactosylceramide sulfotransferase-like n=1 Tax=Saccoglossus kowalevskii TaxID=10224 RepID=A0ABM0GW94_SACKO|nr:PREDICTED: galactosylceramide sulfotransferase-like [Saccoglossus kowalevskii]